MLQQGYLADLIVGDRLFASYLPESCIAGTADKALLRQIVDTSPWSKPVRVYGYNSMDVVFGGDFFEAETNCINSLGQVASASSNNLGFWRLIDPIVEPVLQSPFPPPIDKYDSSKTYIALVYGDMDNLDFVRSFGSDHMKLRVALCANNSAGCFPFTWTLSPNLLHVAPAMLRWYYAQASTTGGKDHFIMPPSGTLYAYPSMMPEPVMLNFTLQQTEQAIAMNTSGSIHWEWCGAASMTARDGAQVLPLVRRVEQLLPQVHAGQHHRAHHTRLLPQQRALDVPRHWHGHV